MSAQIGTPGTKISGDFSKHRKTLHIELDSFVRQHHSLVLQHARMVALREAGKWPEKLTIKAVGQVRDSLPLTNGGAAVDFMKGRLEALNTELQVVYLSDLNAEITATQTRISDLCTLGPLRTRFLEKMSPIGLELPEAFADGCRVWTNAPPPHQMNAGPPVAPRLSEVVKQFVDTTLMLRLKLKQQTLSAAKAKEDKEAKASAALASEDLTLESLAATFDRKIKALIKNNKGFKPNKDGSRKKPNHPKPSKAKGTRARPTPTPRNPGAGKGKSKAKKTPMTNPNPDPQNSRPKAKQKAKRRAHETGKNGNGKRQRHSDF